MIELIARELAKEYPLSMDESQIVAYAYRAKDMPSQIMPWNPNPPPAGYFDSTFEASILDLSQPIGDLCRELVSKGFLVKCPSRPQMVRIADGFIPVCEQILNRCPCVDGGQ